MSPLRLAPVGRRVQVLWSQHALDRIAQRIEHPQWCAVPKPFRDVRSYLEHLVREPSSQISDTEDLSSGERRIRRVVMVPKIGGQLQRVRFVLVAESGASSVARNDRIEVVTVIVE
jgi:hypothetical protein